jgi:hypothetical protein
MGHGSKLLVREQELVEYDALNGCAEDGAEGDGDAAEPRKALGASGP